MDLIIAIIQPAKLEATKDALVKLGVQGMTVFGVKGFGRQRGRSPSTLAEESLPLWTTDFLPKVRLEVVAPSTETEHIVKTIIQTAQTGQIGDGRIFVVPIAQSFNIRTGLPDDASMYPALRRLTPTEPPRSAAQ